MKTTGYLLPALVLLALPALSGAQDDAIDDLPPSERPSTHCVSLSQIDRTEVIDDRNIVFHMRGKKLYRNQLPHRCPGLSSRKAFMYRTSLNQLCDLDIITVLDDMGFGFMPGASCGLGLFYEVSAEEVEDLKELIRKQRD